MTVSESKMNGAQMSDKEMLDWVEANIFKISQDFNEEFAIEFYDSVGIHKVVRGSSLRDCIQKAQPKIEVKPEHHFMFDGLDLKTVVSGTHLCTGCDFYPQDCDKVNDYLKDSIGRNCGDTLPHWHIMFVNKHEKDSYFED